MLLAEYDCDLELKAEAEGQALVCLTKVKAED